MWSILKGRNLTGLKDTEKWVCKLAQVIFKMHKAGVSYKETCEVMDEAQKRFDLFGYVEEWMKEYNPKGLKYIN